MNNFTFKKQFTGIFLFYLVLIVINCTTTDDSCTIIFPADGAKFHEDYEITICSNSELDSIDWYSSIDRYLGTGIKITVKLSTGEHIIDALFRGMFQDNITIIVDELVFFAGNKREIIINDTFQEILLPAGKYSPICISTSNQNDPESEAYNPTSNEMEIMYTGYPTNNPDDLNYSSDSIIATIAHELEHLIHFYQKTYSEIEKGNNL